MENDVGNVLASIFAHDATLDAFWTNFENVFISTDTYAFANGYKRASVADGLMAIADAMNRIADALQPKESEE